MSSLLLSSGYGLCISNLLLEQVRLIPQSILILFSLCPVSLHDPSSPADVSSRAMMKFESGYDVDTVFDGSNIGIEPHSIQVSGDGELLILDSRNSNMYKISIPLSRRKFEMLESIHIILIISPRKEEKKCLTSNLGKHIFLHVLYEFCLVLFGWKAFL